MGELRQYSDELKAEALKMIIEQGISYKEVCDLLGIPKGTIGSWGSKAMGQYDALTPGSPSMSDIMADNRRLRKELAQAKMEKDILKKATAYFAKESLPCTRS